MLEFRILGPLEVLSDDRPIRLGGPKQRAALAILLLSANRVVSVERLADDLYAGAPPVTAVTQVQRQISELRKLLGAETIETRSPGYILRVEPERLDLDRFERWTHDALQAHERGDAQAAADLLGRSLDLWRGAPLADLTYESFARTAIARLDELRVSALEQRLDAELELGRHAQLLAELEALVWDHPLRERLRGQLMLALYRVGRQAEALEVYRRTRETLIEEFGIEPSKSLRDLEQRILTQDPTLDAPRAASPSTAEAERTLLVVPSRDDRLDALLSVAEPLAALPNRALLIARLVVDESAVVPAFEAITARTTSLGVSVRTALSEHSPADLAVLSVSALRWQRGSGVFVPFGGGANDWAALELGAWLAAAVRIPLRLVGTTADASRGRRDASRLLADASLATQRVVGVAAEPLFADPTSAALLAAVEPATVVVIGFPSRWRAEGLGDVRLSLLRAARAPVLLVHRGTRPGGLAPRESRTRFSWSLEP